MKLVMFLALVCATVAVFAQNVNQVDGPPGGAALQRAYIYNGSNQLIGICWSRSSDTGGDRSRTQVSISAISKASPAVVTSTGHGIPLDARPIVTISGATGTGWATGINGAFTATVIDVDTFSVPVDSSAFGTLAGTVVFTTTGPRTSVAEWAVRKLAYDGSGNVRFMGWLRGKPSFDQACSDSSSTSIQQQ